MIWPFTTVLRSLQIWGLVFNVLLAILLFRLRILAEDHPLTKSQRWALTIAAWLYLANSGQLLFEILMAQPATEFPPMGYTYVTHVRGQFNMFATFLLLMFGLVYPALTLRWSRLRLLLGALALLAVPVFLINFRYDFPIFSAVLGSDVHFLMITYLPACFIPIFLWLPIYWKHNSPQLDNILTILIWGYFFVFAVGQTGGFILSVYLETTNGWFALEIILYIVVYFLLIKTVYHKRGQWGTAERMNMVLMASALALALFWGFLSIYNTNNPGFENSHIYQLFLFICGPFGWIILRPSLFSYGLLRYQFFGPKVNVARYFEVIMAVVISSLAGFLTTFFLGPYNHLLAIGAGLVMFLILIYPAYRLAKLFVLRSLPMSGGSATAPLAERRATYLMGLQTAVVDGEILDEYDKEALESLRTDLNVSKREHDLLMDGFLRYRPQTTQDQIEEAYLFHKNGMLLGYVTREGGRSEGKEGMMAAMLSTVGKFASDALRKGSDSVESIEYGNVTLIVETEGDVALGVLLTGKDNPQVRQRMRDILGGINKEYGRAIQSILDQGSFEQMQEAKNKMKGLEERMRRFLREGGG